MAKILTFRLDKKRNQIIEHLKEDTGEVAATKALMKASLFFINDKPKLEHENTRLANELYEALEKLEKHKQFYLLFKELLNEA